jgi:hypothetical protein
VRALIILGAGLLPLLAIGFAGAEATILFTFVAAAAMFVFALAAVGLALAMTALALATTGLAFAIVGLADLMAAFAAGFTIETGVAFFAGAFTVAFLAAAGAAFLAFDDFDLTGIMLLLNEYDERPD